MRSTFATHLPTRGLVTSTLAALILTVSIPLSAVASDAGVWKVDPAKSSVTSRGATLTLRRAAGAGASAGSFIVISGKDVYRVTGSAASDSRGLKPVDFEAMARTGEAVLIGTHPRSPDFCGPRCQAGLSERVRTLTFKVVKTGEQQIRDMLASEGLDE